MEERIDWHKIFQETLEDIRNLQVLSGKIIAGKAREYHQMIRADFICHTEGNIPSDKLKPIIRPFDHLSQDLENIETLKKIIDKISGGAFMNVVQEAETKGKIERSQEIAIEMLKDGMEINQIIKFTKLPAAEIWKLKQQLEAKSD